MEVKTVSVKCLYSLSSIIWQNGIIYSVFYGVTATISTLFEEAYPFLSETDIGLCFLAIGFVVLFIHIRMSSRLLYLDLIRTLLCLFKGRYDHRQLLHGKIPGSWLSDHQARNDTHSGIRPREVSQWHDSCRRHEGGVLSHRTSEAKNDAILSCFVYSLYNWVWMVSSSEGLNRGTINSPDRQYVRMLSLSLEIHWFYLWLQSDMYPCRSWTRPRLWSLILCHLKARQWPHV